jgi:hypothetical protein
MKAKELAALLLTDPEADVKIGWEELVVYSDHTQCSEDRISDVEAVFRVSGDFVISLEGFLIGERVWNAPR